MNNDLTQKQLKKLLNYDPETGIFTWAIDRGTNKTKGKRTGTIDNGYTRIKINGKLYLAHRLAWLYMTGTWPENLIDHIDMDRSNNKFSNLREATQSENMRNCGLISSNTSGHKGVRWHKWDKKWTAQIRINGKYKHLGSFVAIEDAIKAYEEASKLYHGDFGRTA